jgi:hypothetical protein
MIEDHENIIYNEVAVIVLLTDFCNAIVLESIPNFKLPLHSFHMQDISFPFHILQVAKFINLLNNTLDKLNLSHIIQ